VRLRNGEGKDVKPDNLKPPSGEGLSEKAAKNGLVLVFWGNATWSRTQLLGEIARGHWGLCKGSVQELVSPPAERWAGLQGRLAFAPVTEMTEGFMRAAQAQMANHATAARRGSVDMGEPIEVPYEAPEAPPAAGAADQGEGPI